VTSTTYSSQEIFSAREHWTNLPVGRPVANTGILLLDSHLQPVPVGVPGEVFISGAGLARGYHRRPDLTASRYVPHPRPAHPGERLYRTGDLGRYLPDGNLQFLGRIDNQVKIRGFRIELGEIETVLAQHPNVGEAVAAVREDAAGNKHLTAYIVPTGPHPALTTDVAAYLRSKLPRFMVPDAIVVVESVPVSPNGKVDRNALPAPDQSGGDERYLPPRTDTERTIAAMWSDALKVDRVGRHDDFFELGGDSLTAMSLWTRLTEKFRVRISLQTFFETSVLEELGATVDGAATDAGAALRSPLSWVRENKP
jgi:acyl carrier protein